MLDLSIVIPFKDKAALTISCLDSLYRYGEDVKEIILISNGSSRTELGLVKSVATNYKNTRLLEYNFPFNYQKINNWGVKQSTGKVIMLLNNDVELIEQSRGLLSNMHKRALQSKTGAVGCVLLYEDRKTIQHAGVYLVAGGTGDHLFIGKSFKKTISKIASGRQKLPDIRRDLSLSAVTAAALMVERKKFDKIGMMNEDFVICGGDVDLCLRLEEAGYGSLMVGANYGVMVHKESKSRSLIAVPYIDFVESYKSYVKHFDITKGDPFISKVELQNAQ